MHEKLLKQDLGKRLLLGRCMIPELFYDNVLRIQRYTNLVLHQKYAFQALNGGKDTRIKTYNPANRLFKTNMSAII